MSYEYTLVHSDGTTLTVESGGSIVMKAGATLSQGGAAPVTLPIAAAAQAVSTQTQTSLTDNTGGTPSTTLAAETPFTPSVEWNGSSVFPSATDAAVLGAIDTAQRNAIASLAAKLALVKTDVALLVTLTNAMRSALISAGIIKGSA